MEGFYPITIKETPWKPLENTEVAERAHLVLTDPYSGSGTVFGVEFRFGPEDCLRILEHNGFRNPIFEYQQYGGMFSTRCLVEGPDGERYPATTVLAMVLKAERLECLCRDRSDAVMGLLRRKEK